MKKYPTIDEFLSDQPAEMLEQVEKIRQIIKDSEPGLAENIKWNAPNYNFDGIDRMTLNLMNKDHKLKLILHMGSSKKENKNAEPVLKEGSGIIDWSSDIRGYITFNDFADIQLKQGAIEQIIKNWLKIKP